LIEAVKKSLSFELFSNAAFLCEKLYAQTKETKNEEVKLLLAECYLGIFEGITIKGEGKAYKAYEVLKDCQANANRYKFALVCLKLNKLADAERVLLNKRAFKNQPGQSEYSVPNGAAGFYLLGLVCEKQIKIKDAIEFYTKALELDPTLWCAYEKLCKLNQNLNPKTIFND